MENHTKNPGNQLEAGPSCVICFEQISLDTKAIIKVCAHEFCLVCIRSWVEATATCPLCKQEIDVLQHSFTSDGTYQEEKVEAPNIKRGDSGGGPAAATANMEEQLQCLDHAFFITEVQRLLQDAERMHVRLFQEKRTSHRGLNAWEQQQLEILEGVLAELRNHKRKLQAFLRFDPHATLQDLYRLQDLIRGSFQAPVVSHARSRSPVRYSADDADAVADLSDEDDFADDMSYMSISKGKSRAKPAVRQAKSKVRTPAEKIGNSKGRKGIAN